MNARLKKLGLSDAGFKRIAQGVDMSDVWGPDEDLRRQLNSVIDTLVEFREDFDSDFLTELGRTQGEQAARALVEAVWPALDAVYNFIELGEE